MALTLKKKRWFDGGRHARRDPYPLMLGLAMGSSSILFFFILLLLLMRKTTVGMPSIPLPIVFTASTFLIALSSLTLTRGRQAFLAEKYRLHVNYTALTLCLGVLFLILQLDGWWQIYKLGYTMQDHVGAAFLFVLSGLHFGHMALAVGLLFWALVDSSRNQTYVEGFLQSINPAKRTRLLLAYWFWHFTDVLWLILFAVFYFVLQG